MPWLHHHVRNSSEDVSSVRLVEHLQSWHAATAEDENGWHVHFATLDDILRGSGCPVPPASGDPPVLPIDVTPCDHSTVKTLSLCVFSMMAIADDCPTPWTPLFSHESPSQSPVLLGATTSRSLKLLLCVAQI